MSEVQNQTIVTYSEELYEDSTIWNFRIVQKKVIKDIFHHNLDVSNINFLEKLNAI